MKVFGERWQETAEMGRLVFQNKNNIVKPNNVLPDLIFRYVVDNDLTKLEEYFLEQGFLGFPVDLVDSKLPVTSVGVSRCPNYSVTHFSTKEALEYINESFGNEKTTGRKL